MNLHLNNNESKIEKFQKIYYVSTIKTNIIFIQKLNRKEFIFYVELRQHVNIKKSKKMFIYTDYMKRQYVVEYNSSTMSEFFHLNDSAAFTSIILSSLSESLSFQRDSLLENLCLTDTSESLFHCFSMKLWHRQMSHINVEFLIRLSNTAERVNIKDKKLWMLCEICKLSHEYQKIFRKSCVCVIALYKHVHMNIIQFEAEYNSHQWALHLYDNAETVHKTHIFHLKSEIFLTVKEFIVFIEKQHKVRVKIIHFDEKHSLDKNFEKWTLKKEIEMKFSALYIKEQNETIEWADKLILKCVRVL